MQSKYGFESDSNKVDVPTPLSRKGRQAATVIRNFMKKYDLGSGGCTTFYSPQEWADREEDYGTESELVIVYDGGDLYDVMNGYRYKLEDELTKALDKVGVYFEPCTSWYCAVYEN